MFTHTTSANKGAGGALKKDAKCCFKKENLAQELAGTQGGARGLKADAAAEIVAAEADGRDAQARFAEIADFHVALLFER